MSSPIEFGRSAFRDHYLLDQSVTYLNQGSYGPCPRFVYDELLAIRKKQEENPDRWFRLLKAELYVKSLHVLADRLDCQFDQVALVENVTCGTNAILKTLMPFFQPGGTIFCTNLAYGSVIYTIKEAARQHQMHVHTIDIKLPIKNKETIIKQIKEEISKMVGSDFRLAVIDHITSSTAILMPIEELTELFHRRNIPVLIDGAHALNQILGLSLSNLKCDFYIGALHKWMFTARGSSFVFVRDQKVANQIQPPITSWGYLPTLSERDMSPFHLQFFHQGTRDEAAMFTLSKAIEFVDSTCGGFKRIYDYNSTLSRKAKETLDERWKNKGNHLFPREMEAPFLKLVKLPDLAEYEKTDADALRLLENLIADYQIVTIVICIDGELYLRLSTQIYNQIDDYIRLAETIDGFRRK